MEDYHYIQPGEFSYCSCGVLLVPVRGQLCGECKAKAAHSDNPKQYQVDFVYWQGVQLDSRMVGNALLVARTQIAAMRRNNNYKPMFWLEEKQAMIDIANKMAEAKRAIEQICSSDHEQ